MIAPRLIPAIALLTAFSASLALAADWPTFKPGNWSFERTMTGSGAPLDKVSHTECTDPAADQKEQRDMLAKVGCEFSPLVQSGNTYRYSATCKMGGSTTRSDSVLEVTSAEAFTITVDSVTGDSKTHEVLTAHRIGDCAR
jgi:hypothetical protein